MLLPADPTELDDTELWLAWRSSFVILEHAVSAAERLHVVDVRQTYLDELAHRNSAVFSAWMTSAPNATGDTGRFFA